LRRMFDEVRDDVLAATSKHAWRRCPCGGCCRTISDLIAEPEGPSLISHAVTHRRVDRRYS
jgi:hypothetical protein